MDGSREQCCNEAATAGDGDAGARPGAWLAWMEVAKGTQEAVGGGGEQTPQKDLLREMELASPSL
ncbi:hypothetical protein E2562_005186 [Oryza meyeriana var. granulata]|uniref:Uncharacterized protein n=1 Tax=Oryza meyeriana var. granulata TaxID=110450 RepID=A0A6G1BTN6_9ORYZ|nr:hypothetical protein E2562_005186 [Oryza meyeriana var. granulata]